MVGVCLVLTRFQIGPGYLSYVQQLYPPLGAIFNERFDGMAILNYKFKVWLPLSSEDGEFQEMVTFLQRMTCALPRGGHVK